MNRLDVDGTEIERCGPSVWVCRSWVTVCLRPTSTGLQQTSVERPWSRCDQGFVGRDRGPKRIPISKRDYPTRTEPKNEVFNV